MNRNGQPNECPPDVFEWGRPLRMTMTAIVRISTALMTGKSGDAFRFIKLFTRTHQTIHIQVTIITAAIDCTMGRQINHANDVPAIRPRGNRSAAKEAANRMRALCRRPLRLDWSRRIISLERKR